MARLIVAGDLVESPRPCRRTSEDVHRLREWLLRRGVSMLVLEGNHDRGLAHSSVNHSRTPEPIPSTCMVASWTIGHGHMKICGERTVSGHHHPVLRVESTAAPCFLVGPGKIVLPAFSFNAAGCDIATAALPRDWKGLPLRCIVSTGSDLLDFRAPGRSPSALAASDRFLDNRAGTDARGIFGDEADFANRERIAIVVDSAGHGTLFARAVIVAATRGHDEASLESGRIASQWVNESRAFPTRCAANARRTARDRRITVLVWERAHERDSWDDSARL